MTTDAFAGLVDARRTGPGTWQARCPAHQDRSPSLSIRAGSDGRVLLHCFAGCALDSILAALKLSRRDLFAGVRLTPAEARRVAQERERRNADARNLRWAHGAACDRVRRWEAIVNALGAKLTCNPEDSAMAKTFHAACTRLHEIETQAEELNSKLISHGRRPNRP